MTSTPNQMTAAAVTVRPTTAQAHTITSPLASSKNVLGLSGSPDPVFMTSAFSLGDAYEVKLVAFFEVPQLRSGARR
jgi:hypothetical protein